MKFLVFLMTLLSALSAIAAEQTTAKSDAVDAASRGKYIVESVAMCVQCHTPRDKSGKLIQDRYLDGAPVPIKAPESFKMNWALKAPAIAGLPGYTKEEGVRLLTQGINRDGKTPDPPMPPFRFSAQDAEAVVDYLKSLQ